MPDMKKKIQLLKDTKRLFDENHIEFFAIHGTLLGFVRDKQIIPWDEDIDIGAWYYNYDKIANLKEEFEKIGCKLTFGSGKYSHINITPYEELDAKKNSDSGPFHIGIDFWAKDKDKAVLLKFFDENMFDRVFGRFGGNSIYKFFRRGYYTLILFMRTHEVYPYSWFEKMKTIRVYNLDFNIPSGYEQYLELTYGSNWRIPDKDYSKEKWLRNNEAIKKYKIRDKNLRNLWIKRGDIDTK